MLVRSSQVSLKGANPGKKQAVAEFLTSYNLVVQKVVDYYWTLGWIPTYASKNETDAALGDADVNLSAAAIQAAAKQASEIVRGIRARSDRRQAKIGSLIGEGKHRQARKLQAIHNKEKISKPKIKSDSPATLDSRMVVTRTTEKNGSFDGWTVIKSHTAKKGTRVYLPFKKTSHFNRLDIEGSRRETVHLHRDRIVFVFQIVEPPLRPEGRTVGLDIGIVSCITTSDGIQSEKDKHGWDLRGILERISRRKRGTKGFARAVQHRQNYINWSIHQINMDQIACLKLENIQGLRKGKRTSKLLQHFTYPQIFDKLESHAALHGVRVEKVSPTYTSQRCSDCGWVRKSNRRGSHFKCGQCGLTLNADLNAARNIALTLRSIGTKERQLQKNRTGFYLDAVGEEFTVPHTQELKETVYLSDETRPEVQ